MRETDGGIRLSLMSNAVWRKSLVNSIEVSSVSSPRTSNEAHWNLIDLQGVGCCLERTYYSQRSRKDGGGGRGWKSTKGTHGSVTMTVKRTRVLTALNNGIRNEPGRVCVMINITHENRG